MDLILLVVEISTFGFVFRDLGRVTHTKGYGPARGRLTALSFWVVAGALGLGAAYLAFGTDDSLPLEAGIALGLPLGLIAAWIRIKRLPVIAQEVPDADRAFD